MTHPTLSIVHMPDRPGELPELGILATDERGSQIVLATESYEPASPRSKRYAVIVLKDLADLALKHMAADLAANRMVNGDGI